MISKKTKVSIVIPVYNREYTLQKTVDSVFGQRFKDWQLILVDDNSTDGSSRIMQRLSSSDDRIIMVNNQDYSHSCAGARLAGIDHATGDYIAFLDSDDTWPEYHLDELVGYLESNLDVDYVFGDLRRIDETERAVIVRGSHDKTNTVTGGAGLVEAMAHQGPTDPLTLQ